MTQGDLRRVDPNGIPVMIRTICSNWEVTQASME